MFKKTNVGEDMQTKTTNFLSNKRTMLIGAAIIITFATIFFRPKPTHIGNISFAGEVVPFDNEYYLNIERLDRELALAQMDGAQIAMIHKRRPLYIPYIESELNKNDIPTDLKYIAIIESALRENITSSAGAAGMWQFMPGTAKDYGLIVTDEIDERLHFEKATQAAIKYLKKLYQDFGNRTLVAAAYNRGENGLKNDMERQLQDDYYDLFLNNETYRYVFRILANKELLENKNRYFTSQQLGNQYQPPKTKTITLGKIDDLKTRAKNNGHTYLEIRQLNPRIRTDKIPEGNREIKVFEKK